MTFIKKNLTFIFGISIPILMIIFIAISIYVPSLFEKPTYNFLYVVGQDYYYNYVYSVENGILIKKEISQPSYKDYARPVGAVVKEPKFFIYDVASDSAREVSFDEAQDLTLDSNMTSPDGFKVVGESNSGGFFSSFYGVGGDYGTKYLKGKNSSKKLNIELGDYNYYDFNFLGWIKK